jgi:DNA polymerase III alpha subunit (gram-positive type)
MMSVSTLGKLSGVVMLGWLLGFLTVALAHHQDPQAEPLLALEKSWVMAHLDVETTGLVAGHHEVVDLGIVYTTVNGEVLDRWYRRIQPQHPERTSPEAAKINGFEPAVWKKLGAIDPAQAVRSLLDFERNRFVGRRVVRVAYNSKFDAAFMDHLLRVHGAAFDQPHQSYYWLDVPSMAWMMGYRSLEHGDLGEQLGVAGKSRVPLEHTGLGCAEYNVRVYRALLAKQGKAR